MSVHFHTDNFNSYLHQQQASLDDTTFWWFVNWIGEFVTVKLTICFVILFLFSVLGDSFGSRTRFSCRINSLVHFRFIFYDGQTNELTRINHFNWDIFHWQWQQSTAKDKEYIYFFVRCRITAKTSECKMHMWFIRCTFYINFGREFINFVIARENGKWQRKKDDKKKLVFI